MSQEKEVIIFETRDPEKEEELKRAEDILEKVEKVLGDIPIGWSIAISRREPGWARGHLETISVNEEQPLDLDYLAQTWGGEVLTARVKDDRGQYVKSVDIPMYSYKPKSWGEELLHPNFRHSQRQEGKSEKIDPFGSVESILSIVERLRGKEEKQAPARDNSLDLGIIELLLKTQLTAQRQNGPLGGVEQFLQMASALKELKGLFGNEEQKPFDENNIIGQVGGILDTYFKYRSTVESKPKTARLAPPSVPRPMIGPVQEQAPSAAPSPPAIVEQLASLDPKTAAEAVLLALDRMSEEHREKALSVFFNHLGVEEEEETFDDNGNKVQNMHNATSADGSPKGER